MIVLTILVFALSFVLQCNANVDQVRAQLIEKLSLAGKTKSIEPSSMYKLVCQCFSGGGFKVPEDVHEQFLHSKPIRFGQNLLPGDFIFFAQPQPNDLTITQSLVYLGDDRFVRLDQCCSDVAYKTSQQLFNDKISKLGHSQLVHHGEKKGWFVYFGTYLENNKTVMPQELVQVSYSPLGQQQQQKTIINKNMHHDTDLVPIASIISSVRCEPIYACSYNLSGVKVYEKPKISICYGVAKKLQAAQEEFIQMGYSLKLSDAYRSKTFQRVLFNACPIPYLVSNPDTRTSKHTRGAAVDVTLVNVANDQELDMGSPIDEVSERSFLRYAKTLSNEQISNRKLLERVMVKHGFKAVSSEWWHFNIQNWRDYPLKD